MKKQYSFFSDKINRGLVFVSILILTIFIGMYQAWGTAVPYPIGYSDSGRLDSIWVIIYDDGVYSDSTLVLDDTTLSLDDGSDWNILYKNFWDGSGVYYADWDFVKYTSGAATISSSDMAEIADSVVARGSGSGTDTLLYTAWDTLNAVAGSSVNVTARFIGGALIGTQATNSSGLVVWTLTAGDTIIYTAVENGLYIWEVDTVVIPVGGGADTLYGYGVTGAVSPTLPSTCNVYLFVLNNDGTPAKGVGVSAFLSRGTVTDSAGNVYSSEPQYKQTDSLGVVYFTCVWSSYLIPATQWRFTGRAPGIGGFRKDYTVPRVTIDTLNLSE